MSASLLYQTRMEHSQAAEKIGNRPFLVLGLFLLFFFLTALIFEILIVPNLVIKKIRFHSGLQLTDEQLMTMAGVKPPLLFFSLDTAAVEKNLLSYAEVESAAVSKQFPDSLVFTINERKPVGLVLVSVGGNQVPALFDSKGIIYKMGPSALASNVPVVSGVAFPDAGIGAQFPQTLKVFVDSLAQLKAAAPEVYDMISEFEIEKKGDEAWDLVMYPLAYPVRVHLGAAADERTVKNAFLVLDALEKQGSDLNKMDEIDFRTGNIVYKVKEARSGNR